MRKAILTVAACMGLLGVSTAQAATDEEKCLAGRAKAAGKYEGCVEKWLSKGYGGGGFDQAKLSKCREKYAAAWTKLQGLTGSTTCSLARFVNNGTTVTDNLTGLIWEQKTDDSTEHDKDNLRSWSTSDDADSTDEDGTVFTTFLSTGLNVAGFAGANGWRLPTLAELMTLVNQPYPCATSPCIDPAFVNTQSNTYWSATTNAGDPLNAWFVDFNDGSVDLSNKATSTYARAVRAGL